ncbi:MAG: DEAD/DEAH box helicase [Planctomycetes bacterium]|nr:DEAD/DEAH box helicase [Planctomycetota bacterium]
MEPTAAAEEAAAPAAEVLAARFDDLNLSEPLLRNLREAGYEKPTPIQAKVIPLALDGRDVLGQAQTGTGKTASFLLPIFDRLKPGQGNPGALILAPTRELAMQIQDHVQSLGTNLGLSSVTLYGGSSYDPQIAALQRGVDLVVGTPGRVMDHMRARRLDLGGVKFAVLDEADRMLDLGFRKDIEYILRHCPVERQTLLLSATFPDEIQKLGRRFMRDPIHIGVDPERLTVDQIEQFYVAVEDEQKWAALLKLLDVERPALAIIFCNTKHAAKKLAARLKAIGIAAREIHGDLVQKKREKIMAGFRSGKVLLLVATDVASRGIDVTDISHIINYNVPFKIEDYVHRIGRTGRIGKSGKAFTLVNREEARFLTEIEILINRELTPVSFPTLESIFWPKPPADIPPEFRTEDQDSEVGQDDYIEDNDRGGGGGGGRFGRRGSGGGGRGGGGRSGGGGGRGRGGHGGGRRDHGPREQAAPAQAAAPDVSASTTDAGPSASGGMGGADGEQKRRRRRRGRRGKGGGSAPGGTPSEAAPPQEAQ